MKDLNQVITTVKMKMVNSKICFSLLMLLILMTSVKEVKAQPCTDSLVIENSQWLNDLVDSLRQSDCMQGCYSNISIYCTGSELVYALEVNNNCADVPTYYYDSEGNIICSSGSFWGTDCDSSFLSNLFYIEEYWQCSEVVSTCDNFSTFIFHDNPSQICVGQTITLAASSTGGTPPYTYVWNDGSISSTITVTPTSPTFYIYTVDALDANGCQNTVGFTILADSCGIDSTNNCNDFSVFISQSNNQQVCVGDTVELSAIPIGGTAPYTYFWRPSFATTSTIVDILSTTTTYVVSVTDANGCVFTAGIVIPDCNTDTTTDCSNLVATIAQNTQIVCIGEPLVLSVVPSGGLPPYSYDWFPTIGNTGQTITVIPFQPTVYSVNVTDVNGCQFQAETFVFPDSCVVDTTDCICATILDPVCVIRGNTVFTYSNSCFAMCDGFTEADFVDCISDTTGCTCTTIFDPVCVAVNGVIFTYTNSCFALCDGFSEADFTSCVSDTTDCVCPEIFDPVCVNIDSTVVTYSNSCFAMCDGYTEADFVDCVSDTTGCTCTAIFDPVCVIINGAIFTYTNGCFALCDGFMESDFITCALDSTEQCIDSIRCVFPGDGNKNYSVNNYDLLNLGFGFGANGPARAQTSIAPQYFNATDWNEFGINAINLKHSDCNGDGTINSSDIDAIDQNYNITASFVEDPSSVEPGITISVNFTVDTIFVENNPGDSSIFVLTADLVLDQGNTSIPISGLALQINFENNEANLIDAFVEFDDDSWLTSNNSTISYQRFIRDLNRLDIAVSRTDQIPVTGNGRIATVTMIIEDIIIGRLQNATIAFNASVENVMTVGNSGSTAIIGGEVTDVIFSGAEDVTSINEWLQQVINIHPNPVRDFLNIQSIIDIEGIQLFGLDGRLIKSVNTSSQIDMSSFPTGQYILKVITKEGVLVKEIIKVN